MGNPETPLQCGVPLHCGAQLKLWLHILTKGTLNKKLLMQYLMAGGSTIRRNLMPQERLKIEMANQQSDQILGAELTLLQSLSSEMFSQILFMFFWFVFKRTV